MLNFLKSLKQRQQEEKEELNQLINKKENLQEQIDEIIKQRDIAQVNFRMLKQSLDKQIADAQNELNEKRESFRLIESGFGELEEIGYERYIPTMLNDDIEHKIFELELEIGELEVKDKIIIVERTYTIDKSAAKGKKFQNGYGKNLLIGFNTYVQNKTKSVTETNYSRTCELIKSSFEKFNKQGKMIGIYLNPKYLELRLEMIHCILELKMKKVREKAELREERKRMREQEKLLEEAKKEKEKLEAQKKAMDIAYAKALTDEERMQIKSDIDSLDKRIDDINYRVKNPKSGWVYIIHSPALPDMVKIGVSRRLNGPYERISELSSSSLPFPFVLDAFCFSDDAFAIESSMHEYFDSVRVAPNREFFYTTPNEAIEVLENKFGQNVIKSNLEEI